MAGDVDGTQHSSSSVGVDGGGGGIGGMQRRQRIRIRGSWLHY